MASDLVRLFARRVVHGLVDEGGLALTPNADSEAVARRLAEVLASRPPHSGLITSVASALIADPDVEDLFAADEDLARLVDDLGSTR